jgi:hypothetical protein
MFERCYVEIVEVVDEAALVQGRSAMTLLALPHTDRSTRLTHTGIRRNSVSRYLSGEHFRNKPRNRFSDLSGALFLQKMRSLDGDL